MATLLESACLIVRSQPSSRDGRFHAVAEDSINGHLREGRSPRMILAGKRILPAQAALEEHKDRQARERSAA